MKTHIVCGLTAVCLLLLSTSAAQAVPLLAPGDFIIAIDTDPAAVASSSPTNGNEDAEFALDNDAGSKYLNFGKLNTGLISTPFYGSSVVKSAQFTTANDAEARDPASWELWGTNDTVDTVAHTTGGTENWTLITSSALSLPTDRGEMSGFVDFGANTTSYDSYRVIFPTVKDEANANSMQIADIQLFTDTAGGGDGIFNFDDATPIGLDMTFDSSYPGAEGPANLLDGDGPIPGAPSTSDYFTTPFEGPGNVIDGTLAKYLNHGGPESGFIVTLDGPAASVGSFVITTANDAENRDPASYVLYGTNDTIASLDNSFGFGENWTEISSGALALPVDRDMVGSAVATGSTDVYQSYKMVFPTLKGAGGMQIAEADFFTSADGSGTDLLTDTATILAIDETAVLGSTTKYLNFGNANSGFIVTPAAGPSVIDGFQVVTANDFDERDPLTWELHGTNDDITSADDGQGTDETWVVIDSGTFDDDTMPLDRFATGDVISITNGTEYKSYRMVFPTLRGGETTTAMQIASVQFFGDVTATPGDADGDGDVDGADFLLLQRNGDQSGIAEWQTAYGGGALSAGSIVPEPTSAVLVLLGVLATSAMGRGRASQVAAS